MRLRTDGIETRKRILHAACEVFAERGYREATVAGICRKAGANPAAINYHFKDKESLYVEVWRQAAAEATDLYPIDGGVPAKARVRERLHGFLVALLRRMMDRGRLGMFHRLRMMEMANPSGLIDRVRWKALQPMREYIHGLLRELLGPDATEQELTYCELNLVGPCLMAQLTSQPKHSGAPLFPAVDVESFADHCTGFPLAGVRSVRSRRSRGGLRA
jgi:AcrR family transcriptional regulator